MTPLGKSLVFYFKYPAEMEQLYWRPRTTGEKPNVKGLTDKDGVLEQVRKVGDAACREMAVFLEACAERLEPPLCAVARVERARGNVERNWGVSWRLWPKKVKQRPFAVGVYLHEGIRAILPWVWCRGGRRGEDEVVRVLGRGIMASTCDFAGDRGTVFLARIDVPIPDGPNDFDVDREPLVDQVVQALKFDAAQVKALGRIAARRN